MSQVRAWLVLGLALGLGLIAGCGSGDPGDCNNVNNKQLNIGDEAPEFRLQDHNGRYVRLSDYRGKSNVVVAFYPAAFTPV